MQVAAYVILIVLQGFILISLWTILYQAVKPGAGGTGLSPQEPGPGQQPRPSGQGGRDPATRRRSIDGGASLGPSRGECPHESSHDQHRFARRDR